MCGIVAIVDKKIDVVDRIKQGLKRLEYRGYDSAGIGVVAPGGLSSVRSVGKIADLEQRLNQTPLVW